MGDLIEVATFTLPINRSGSAQAFRKLRERARPAIVRALNRSIASAKTAMVREVSKDLGLKSSDVRDRIWTSEATTNRLQASLFASPKRIPLVDFKARGPEPSRGKGRGVTAKLPGGAGRYPHAFIATMKSGYPGVFQRPGKGRLPIVELHGPSIARSFTKHVRIGIARGAEQLVKNLRSEFRFAMSRAA